MKNYLWNRFARWVAKPSRADRLITYAMKTPYSHLPSNDDPSYMARYWVFNPYDQVTNKPRWWPLIRFSVRVHHIKREDFDRALHDHPWHARTIILKGWYVEKRLNDEFESALPASCGNREHTFKLRRPGDTAQLRFGEYHTICEVSDGGVWTLFFSWKWEGVWGFLVNGVKVPWREYLQRDGSPKNTTPRGTPIPFICMEEAAARLRDQLSGNSSGPIYNPGVRVVDSRRPLPSGFELPKLKSPHIEWTQPKDKGDCPTCGGDGSIGNDMQTCRICPDCKGTGWV